MFRILIGVAVWTAGLAVVLVAIVIPFDIQYPWTFLIGMTYGLTVTPLLLSALSD